jgi:predicted amidophosphoribosyltransferase
VLYAAIMQPPGVKHCAVCGRGFAPNGNNAKYCPVCAKAVARQKHRERNRKYRSKL